MCPSLLPMVEVLIRIHDRGLHKNRGGDYLIIFVHLHLEKCV